jgi:AcrR family transcriptional regulator
MSVEQDRRTIRREERISRQQEARRRDILAVARGLLSRDGISHFHMERVAEEGGYSRTSIYRYFSSKEDLVMDLAIESVELRVGLYRRAHTWNARPRERAVAFGEVTAMLYPRHVVPEVYAVNAVRRASTPDRVDRFADLEREQNEIVMAVAREGVESGDWKLPADLTGRSRPSGITPPPCGGSTPSSSRRRRARRSVWSIL